jgi:Asp-tRNA(Asn)/Glu-tRNA(Gln) amidotransferase C subunit
MQHYKEHIMENNGKSTVGAKMNGAASTLAHWARQGLESFVATQKILLDLTAQQNSLALGFVRERVNFSPLRPLTGMVDLAGQAMANFVAAQKILLDLAAEENALMLYGVRDGLGLTGTAAAMTDAMREGVQEFVHMQKKYLDMVGKQSQAAVAVITEGKPFEGKNLAEITRESVENFVHTQKKFLDLVTEVTHAETNGKKGPKAHKPEARKKIAELAKQGMEKFVESQKELLDLATKQIEGTMKTTQEMIRPSPEPSTTLGDFARRGVENFINAQKSLLDVAAKPFMPPPPHVPAHAHAAGRRK